MKRSELEDIILEETLKLLEEEGISLDGERLDEFLGLGLLGRGALGLGRAVARPAASRAAQAAARRRLARQAMARTPRSARTPAARAAAGRSAQDSVEAAARARQGALARGGGAEAVEAAAAAEGIHAGDIGLGALRGRLAGRGFPASSPWRDRLVAAGGLYGAGLGREGGLDVDHITGLPGQLAGAIPGIPGIGDPIGAAIEAWNADVPGAAQDAIEAAGDVVTTVTGGGGGGRSRRPSGGGGGASTPTPGAASTPTATPQTGPVQPVATGTPVGGKGGAVTSKGGAGRNAGKLAAAQSTWEATGGTGAVPGGTGPDRVYRMEVDPKTQGAREVRPAARPTNYDPREGELRGIFAENNKEYNSDMKFKRSQLEAMILEELQGLLNEQEGEEELGINPFRNIGIARRQIAAERERGESPASSNREEYLASQASMATPTPEGAAEATRAQGLGQADLPIPQTAATSMRGVNDVDPDQRRRLMRYTADQGQPLETSMDLDRGDREDAAAMGIPTQGGQPTVAADTEQEEERPRRRSRSRREEPAEETAAAPAAAPSAKPTGATAAGTKGPGAATKGAGTKGPGAKGVGAPTTKPAEPAERESQIGFTLQPRDPQTGAALPMTAAEREGSGIDRRAPGEGATINPRARRRQRQRDARAAGALEEHRIHKAMSTLKEGFAKHLPKK